MERFWEGFCKGCAMGFSAQLRVLVVVRVMKKPQRPARVCKKQQHLTSNVGAGLFANAVGQCPMFHLAHR
ncbi:hypothetical protein ACW9IB_27360, partial [Pseudomonas sp. SDO524_S393]